METFLQNETKWFPVGSLNELPDIDNNLDKFDVLRYSLAPGDAIAFHMLTIHGSAGCPGNTRRRVFSAPYIGDDVRHSPPDWNTSPDFPNLKNELFNAEMDHPLFPIVYRKSDLNDTTISCRFQII
jgi:ectoine hydroxylase-related dioxygenase (phytanoyl-CoA dioxygenase family)